MTSFCSGRRQTRRLAIWERICPDGIGGKAPDGQWRLLDSGSAADSDCWIAYDLLEAGRLWKSDGYTQLGRKLLALIAKQEVAELPGFGRC